MISEKMKKIVAGSGTARALFEEGNRLKKIYGPEKVFDFSIGNPNVPAPPEVNQAIRDILDSEESTRIHGYMSNAGFEEVRGALAEYLNERFGMDYGTDNIIMTVGAAGALNIAMRILLNPGEEVIVFRPYFLEYGSYLSNYDAKVIPVDFVEGTFQPDLEDLKAKIGPKTRAVIVNTPHNPTGVIYSEETVKTIAAILDEQQKKNGSPIFIISDEPYRELVYDGSTVPYIPHYYDNTLVCYSYSKSLSLPGERIGYLAIADAIEDRDNVIAAAQAANRTMGMTNSPSLMQLVVSRCLYAKTDVEYYRRNRDALYKAVTDAGFECVYPQGAFYLFVKSPTPDEKEFVERGKKYNILMVPGSAFACPGYVRLAYCVSYENILNSAPEFMKLGEEYK